LGETVTQLSCGQRLVRCLSGQEVDRVPFGVGLGWYPWGSTVRRCRQESGKAQLDIGKELGYERGFVVPDVKFGIWPEVERKVIEKTPEYEIVRNERGIVTRQISGSDSMPERLDYPVKSADDWDRLKKEHLDPNAPGRIPQDWDAFRARLQETGEAVQVGIFPWGVFGTPRDFLGVEELLMGFYEQPEVIRDMMDHLTTLWLSVYQRVAAEVQIDHIHIWEDMSGRLPPSLRPGPPS
jgi:uroporphyrinogen decarboxylase